MWCCANTTWLILEGDTNVLSVTNDGQFAVVKGFIFGQGFDHVVIMRFGETHSISFNIWVYFDLFGKIIIIGMTNFYWIRFRRIKQKWGARQSRKVGRCVLDIIGYQRQRIIQQGERGKMFEQQTQGRGWSAINMHVGILQRIMRIDILNIKGDSFQAWGEILLNKSAHRIFDIVK